MLRWHGGKWILAPWIISRFPSHHIYVEPYAGAASVLLRKPRSPHEIYNDLDGRVVELFRVLQDSDMAARLEALLRVTPFSRAEFNLSYESSPDPVEQARRTLILSFQGFGSDSASRPRTTGFRLNSWCSDTGAPIDWMRYPDQVGRFAHRLQGVVIESRPAVELIPAVDTERTLFYVDPPYLRETRCCRWPSEHAYRHEMEEADHIELAQVLKSVKGMVIISGYDSELYNELFAGWRKETKETKVFRNKRQVEVIWINPAADLDGPLFQEARCR